MTAIFITGASRGIGRALVDLLLEDCNNFVYGMSRKQSVKSENYKHFFVDLSDIEKVKSFDFTDLVYEKYILINNAGVIDPISHVGMLGSGMMTTNLNVNLVAPTILINSFLKKFLHTKRDLHIINVSSGAGKYPIDGWSCYNTSKSGIDMFSLVVDQELKIDNNTHVKIHSIAPGIVDTDMQGEIRNSSESGFSNIEKFKAYYKDGELSNPMDVATKFLEVINSPNNFKDVILDVRKF